jgi:hypothetical protein
MAKWSEKVLKDSYLKIHAVLTLLHTPFSRSFQLVLARDLVVKLYQYIHVARPSNPSLPSLPSFIARY